MHGDSVYFQSHSQQIEGLLCIQDVALCLTFSLTLQSRGVLHICRNPIVL